MNIVDNLVRWMRPEEADDEDEDMTSAWADQPRQTFPQREREPRKEVSIRATARLRVVLVQPKALSDLPAVAENLKNALTVILNVENTDRELSRRMLDVLSGVAYGLDATISRVSSDTYIILPFNVEFESDLVDELQNSGMLRRDRMFGV